jgi:hypothetical protein
VPASAIRCTPWSAAVCAAPDLEFGGETIPGRTVHGAFMAALGDGYATLVAADDLA